MHSRQEHLQGGLGEGCRGGKPADARLELAREDAMARVARNYIKLARRTKKLKRRDCLRCDRLYAMLLDDVLERGRVESVFAQQFVELGTMPSRKLSCSRDIPASGGEYLHEVCPLERRPRIFEQQKL